MKPQRLIRLFTATGLAIAAVLVAGALNVRGASGVIYVDADAAGEATGLSWTDAYTSLQDALFTATSGSEIWVAEGVYYPDEGSRQTDDDRTETFQLQPGVELYGGFDPQSDKDEWPERDWSTHVTVLSGDLQQDDTVNPDGVVTDTANISGTNAYHVVTGQGVDGAARVDGFTITGGNADGSDPHYWGGGMLNDDSSPTLVHLTFSGNAAEEYGGGMLNSFDSNPALIHVTFIANASRGYSSDGGAMTNWRSSSPVLTDVTFVRNHATRTGGAMYNFDSCSPSLTDVVFDGNQANGGGGMYGVFGSNAVLTDVVFIDNKAIMGSGGGMMSERSRVTLTDVTFSGNEASDHGGGMGVSSGSATLTDVIFTGNQAGDDAGDGGGGMWNFAGSSPTLTNVRFLGNRAAYGGAMENRRKSNPTLTNVVFSGNWAKRRGGAIWNYDNCSPSLVNVTFAGNRANAAGTMYNYVGGNPVLTNCILWGNEPTAGPQISNRHNSTTTISHSDVQGSGGSASWDTSLGIDDGGNIDADPRFAAAIAGTAAPTTTGNYRLRLGSPAIDAGDDSVVSVMTDLDGNDRIFSAAVDMGAYESAPRLALRKSAVPSEVVPYHGVMTYTLLLDNSGLLSDTVTLTDTLPAAIVFGRWIVSPTSALRSDQTIGWTGTIMPEEQITVTFTATHTGSYGDVITNTGQVSGTAQALTSTAVVSVQQGYSLAVRKDGEGGGTVTSDLPGIDCGTNCASMFGDGTVVTLSAEPFLDSTFIGWSGDVMTTRTPVTITVSAESIVTATFDLLTHTLETETVGQGRGSVTLDPPGGTYDHGTVVTVTADPANESSFAAWSGDLSGTTNPAQTAVTDDTVITATFKLKTYVITPTAGPGGAIVPAATQALSHGNDITFTIAPEDGYGIEDVSVDGTSEGAIETYVFRDVKSSHVITAAFARQPRPVGGYTERFRRSRLLDRGLVIALGVGLVTLAGTCATTLAARRHAAGSNREG